MGCREVEGYNEGEGEEKGVGGREVEGYNEGEGEEKERGV